MKTNSPDFEVLPPAKEGEKDFVRILAYILDDLIPIPGTKYRVGLDPLIGLIPGIGDTSATAFSSIIMIRALQSGVPRIVLVRMAMNILLNSLLGAIPGIGDLFSAWFKSNNRNYQLLQKHSGKNSRVSTKGDWTFLIVILALLLAVTLTITLAVGYLALRMLSLLFS